MTDLIAILTSEQGTGSYNHVKKLSEREEWSKIIIVTDNKNKVNFAHDKNLFVIEMDFTQPIDDLVRDLSGELRKIITSHEVALNFVSGKGKEHMALISSIMKVGVGFRLIACTRAGVEEI